VGVNERERKMREGRRELEREMRKSGKGCE
jgi:hypothetical protein